jgi:hypothetical protein
MNRLDRRLTDNGLDKFVGLLTNWEQYLAPQLDALIPCTAQHAMLAVGVVEILAGLLVAVLPRIRICGRRLAGRHHPQPAAHRRLLRHRTAGLRAARGHHVHLHVAGRRVPPKQLIPSMITLAAHRAEPEAAVLGRDQGGEEPEAVTASTNSCG